MEIGITDTLEPIRVNYSATTNDGETITGSVYTLNKETLVEAYKKLASKLNTKEKLSRLCLHIPQST